MRNHTLIPALLAVATLTMGVVSADAQSRRGGSPSGGGQVAPRSPGPSRTGPPLASRPIIGGPGGGFYRPYYYPYGPGFSIGFGFYAGYPYGYPYGYLGYGYPGYGYPYGYYPGYDYPYGYGPAYGGYMTAAPGVAYGGLRVQGAPAEAQVFADGYYVGVVDDVDGVFQHADLPAGPHQIEIRTPGGAPPTVFDVRIEPGQTITYHADKR